MGCKKLFLVAMAMVLFCLNYAFAIPIYVVDASSWPNGTISSRIIVTDSANPKNETVLNSNTGHELTDIAITPNGNNLYAIGGTKYSADSANYMYRYDPSSGKELDSWNIGADAIHNAIVAESETSLLMMANNSKNLWRIHLDENGNYLRKENLGRLGKYSSGDLAISPDGQIYFASVDKSGSSTATNRLNIIDLSGKKPAIKKIGIITTSSNDSVRERPDELTQIYGLSFDENGVLYAGRGNPDIQNVYTINLKDASATYAWSMAEANGIFGFASVPEPMTILLLTLGIGFVRTKRK